MFDCQSSAEFLIWTWAWRLWPTECTLPASIWFIWILKLTSIKIGLIAHGQLFRLHRRRISNVSSNVKERCHTIILKPIFNLSSLSPWRNNIVQWVPPTIFGRFNNGRTERMLFIHRIAFEWGNWIFVFNPEFDKPRKLFEGIIQSYCPFISSQ